MDDEQKQSEVVEKEKYLRLAADLENLRKECAKREERAIEFGKAVVIEDIAAALDNFDIAFGQTMPEPDSEWKEGILQAVKEFLRVLEKYHVKRIDTTGAVFDPMIMEAVHMKPPDQPSQSGTVATEVRSGYMLHDRVIRPARVIIYQ